MGKAMVPVGVIADMVCQEIGDNTGGKKLLILQYIALLFQKMHLFLNQDVCIKTEVLELNATQYEMPSDFMYATKIGIRRIAMDGKPAGKISVLELNTDLARSVAVVNDTEFIDNVNESLDTDFDGECDCYFYNSQYGTFPGYGSGYLAMKQYYNVNDGVLNISPYLHKLRDTELVIEYKSDGLSGGLSLVPSEAFLCLRAGAHSLYNKESVNGPNQLVFESEWKTLKRLYNFRSIDQLVELFSNR